MNSQQIINRAKQLTSSEAETIREHYQQVTFKNLNDIEVLVEGCSRAARKAHREARRAALRAGYDSEGYAPADAAAAAVDRDRLSEADFDLMTRAWRAATGETE